MSDRCKETLEQIEKLDPYWQKFEWHDIKADDPVFYKELLAYKDSLNNDRPKKTEDDSLL